MPLAHGALLGPRTSIAVVFASLTALAAACGTTASSSGPGGGNGGEPTGGGGPGGTSSDASTSDAPDAGDAGDAGAESDAGLTPCPTTGLRVITAPGVSCFTLTPAETGAAASGENATVPSYALFPDTNARGQLVVFFNGSGGKPGGSVIASPTQSFYTAATSLGYAVLGLSYYSTTSIGDLCANSDASLQDACFFPTRQSIILGVAQPGANTTVAQEITVDQGIVGRIELALTELAARDPAHAWGSFLTTGSGGPETRIAWSKIVASGHSQGGGHAAAVGKLFGVARVIQLSSVCDNAGHAAASWTTGTTGPWASDPTQFYGLGAPTVFTGTTPTGGDTTCPAHAANWSNLGMVSTHQHDDAATCGVTGDTHDESIACADNYAAWVNVLQ